MKKINAKISRKLFELSEQRQSLRQIVFALILFFVAGVSVTAQTKTIVSVAVETIVENQTINLGDVARISGDAAQIERLKNISLGYAPNIGAVQVLTRERIALAISAAGFAAAEVRLDAAPSVSIRRAAQEISRATLLEAVENAVRNQISAETIDARLIKIDLPEKIFAPNGKVEIRTNLAGVRNLFARFAVSIEIRVDDRTVRRFSANAEIEAFVKVFVAAQNLAANAKITAADVRLEKRRIENPLSFYLRDVEKLRGTTLVKNVAAGMEITSDSFVASIVIRVGDRVRIVGQSGKMQIIVNGEARASGKIGDRIAVKNLQSNAVLQAVVEDEGLVKVIF